MVREPVLIPQALSALLSGLFRSVVAVAVFAAVVGMFLLYTGLVLMALRRNGIEQGTFLHFIICMPLTLLPGMVGINWLKNNIVGRKKTGPC